MAPLYKQAGLYIHIPFCQKKCNYCNFYSVTVGNRIPEFLAAVKREMDYYRNFWPEYDTLYLGGGTPSLLTGDQLADLLKKIRQTFSFTPGAEWTIELNPDDVTLSFLQDLRSLGFNRLSLGVQSIQDRSLKWLGRRHNTAQSLQAIEWTRQAGFGNLGVDLIYGLPEKSISGSLNLWLKELNHILQYTPEHISCYQLSFEPHTPLALWRRKKLVKPLEERKESQYFLDTAQQLESAGYLHYEVSNFSRGEKYTSRHNQKYWRHLPYLGLGPSAHSFRQNQRQWNQKTLSLYLGDIQKGIIPIAGKENLGLEELRMETLYFGFRTRRGLDLKNFQQQFGQDILNNPPDPAYRLIQENKLTLNGKRLCPTSRGLALADSLALLW